MQDDLLVTKKSDLLSGVRIVFAITGSIAATEAVKQIRELRRHGALVQVFVSNKAKQFVTITSLEWASSQSVIDSFTGDASHIFNGDILLICPATLNIIAKLASGICDDPISTIGQSCLGLLDVEMHKKSKDAESKKMPTSFGIIPCMHLSMSRSPVFQKSLRTLVDMGVQVYPYVEHEEEKVKAPSPNELLNFVISLRQSTKKVGKASAFSDEHNYSKKASKKTNAKKRCVLITSGAVSTPIDAVRSIVNNASGKTGAEIAKYAHFFGADVHLLANANQQIDLPDEINLHTYKNFDDYRALSLEIVRENNPMWAIFTAAVSDFQVSIDSKVGLASLKEKNKMGKLSSSNKLSIDLSPTPKVIAEVAEAFPSLKIVGFKLDDYASAKEMKEALIEEIKQKDYDVLVGCKIDALDSLVGGDSMRIVVNTNKQANGGEKFAFHKFVSRTVLAEYLANIVTLDD